MKKILAQYGIRTNDELKRASFVSKKWADWRESTPEEGFQDNYLASKDYQKHRCHLVHAITSRWVALYQEWYDSLLIRELFL